MHIYHHDESGVTIHYNSKCTGDAIVVIPLERTSFVVENSVVDPGRRYLRIEGVPCCALIEFSHKVVLNAVTCAVEGLY